ncbi:Fe2+/uptake regulation protein [Bacteroidales bacterium 6E]|nr:Fe2+/uptake regulation protein [Bacteroidales bacterium 6E]
MNFYLLLQPCCKYYIVESGHPIHPKNPEPEELLQSRNLRRTSCRQGILDILAQATAALTENEIKALLDKSHDRTTFYRSFRTLIDKNLVHRIVVDNLVVKYALNPQSYGSGEHVHFYCTRCDNIICIDNTHVSGISLPLGFEAEETEVIIKGTCKSCKLNKNTDHNE